MSIATNTRIRVKNAWKVARTGWGAQVPPMLWGGIVVMLIFIFLGVLGPYVAPADPYATNIGERLQSPTSEHLLGTDQYGRDVLSRIFAGAQVSLLVAGSVAVLSFVFGTILGGVSGFLGGWVDRICYFVMNTILALPGFLLALGIVALWGGAIRNVIIALVVAYTPRVGMVMRSVTQSIVARPYVEAATVLGVGKWRNFARHIIPNAIGPVVIVATTSAAFAVLAEAALSFLGLGVQPPEPSWGTIIADGRAFLFSHPWISLAPGIFIGFMVAAINIIGEALRDIIDPTVEKK